MSSPAAGDGVEVLPGQEEDLAENTIETFAGDYPHETDKVLLSFALHWDVSAAVWGDFYAGVQPPDPVFSFERPPKPFVA